MADGKVVIETGLDSTGLKKGLNNLKPQFTEIGNTSTKAMNQISNSVGGATKSMSSLKSSLKGIIGTLGLVFSLKALINFGQQAVNVASDLTEVDDVVQKAFGNMRGEMDALADSSIKNLGISRLEAYQTGSTFMAMGKSMLTSSQDAKDMALNLTKLSANMASFFNTSNKYAAIALKSIYTGETETLKQYGVVMTEVNLKQFALAQGISKSYEEMSQSERVMLRYQYVIQQLGYIGDDFIDTQDSWANQTRVLSEQWKEFLGVLGTGIITILTPLVKALNMVLGRMIAIAKSIGSVLSNVFGIQVQSANQVSGTVSDTADAFDDASTAVGDYDKATKKASKTASKSLASFDKLNNTMTSQSDSGTGTGGAGGGGGITTPNINSGADSALTQANSKINTVLDNVKKRLLELVDLVKKGFKNGLGTDFDASIKRTEKHLASIGKQLQDIFTNPNVINAANNWANNVAYALGQLAGSMISIGQTIIENLVGGVDSFLSKDSGYITDRIVGLFDISSRVAQITGNLSTAIAEIFTVFRSDTAKNITGDFMGINADLALGFMELTGRLSSDLYNLIAQPIIDNKDKIQQAVMGLLEPISIAMDTIHGAIKNTFEQIFNVYDEYLAPAFQNITDGFSSLVSSLLDVWNSQVAPFLTTVATAIQTLWETHLQPFVNNLITLVGKIVLAISELWKNVLEPLIAWIVANVVPVITPILETMVKTVSSIIGTIADILSGIMETLGGIIDFITGVFTGDWSLAWQGVQEIFTGIWNALTGFISGIWSTIESIFTGAISIIVQFIQTGFNAAKTVITTIFGGIKTFISNTWSGIKSIVIGAVNVLKSYVINGFNYIKSGITGVMNTILSIISGIWRGIYNVARTYINYVLSGIQSMVNGIIGGLNSMIRALNHLHFSIPDWVPGLGGKSLGFNLGTISRVSLPRLATGAVLPANQPFLSVVGDQKHGTNIEAPLDTIKQALKETLQGMNMSDNSPIVIEIDGKEVFRAIRNQDRQFIKQTGKSAFSY
jgi:phage-related protein|nr:MAG TPA: minor tail protein [Caudoviricetes sp.]